MSQAKRAIRETWRAAVFARDEQRCVVCRAPAVDAHHLLDRDLFVGGGYILENGVSLCEAHHRAAEASELLPARLRELAGICSVVLPPGYDASRQYDKWGRPC